MDPTIGFLVAGVLYAWIAFIVVGLIIRGLEEWLGLARQSSGAQVLTIVAFLVGAPCSWLLFAWWKRRRRANKQELVRNGRFVQVSVARHVLHLGFMSPR